MLFYHSFGDFQEIMDCFAALLAMTMDTALLAMTVVSICPSATQPPQCTPLHGYSTTAVYTTSRHSTTVGLHKCLAEVAAEVLYRLAACVNCNW